VVSLDPGLYPFKENFFTTQEGQRLHYVDEGPRNGRLLLMVHGNPSWSFLFREVIKELSSRHRCVAIDHLGCGKSGQPLGGPYDLEHHIDRLVEFVKHLDLGDITLLLHDWGGAIGLGMAGRLPGRISAISLFNTAAFTDTMIPARIAIFRWPILGPFLNYRLNAFARAATVMAMPKGAVMPAKVKAGFLHPYGTPRSRRAIHAFVKDIPMNPHHPSWNTLKKVEEGLGQFSSLPILIFWGEQDFCFNTHFRDRWVQIWPQAQVHSWPGGSHYLLETHWKEVCAELALLLDNNPR